MPKHTPKEVPAPTIEEQLEVARRQLANAREQNDQHERTIIGLRSKVEAYEYALKAQHPAPRMMSPHWPY